MCSAETPGGSQVQATPSFAVSEIARFTALKLRWMVKAKKPGGWRMEIRAKRAQYLRWIDLPKLTVQES